MDSRKCRPRMKFTPHFILWVASIAVVHTSKFSKVKDNELSNIQRAPPKFNEDKGIKYFKEIYKDISKKAKEQAYMMKRGKKKKLQHTVVPFAKYNMSRGNNRVVPVLNVLTRRKKNSDSSSSSLELPDWKDEWRELWIQKKYEAINSSLPTGDTVNMVAARPWGVACGDPNQHDMPWGSCTMPMECEPEYRIYRGDYFCGRSRFVCCALQLTTYDLYQGFDASFADSDLLTDSEEIKNVYSRDKAKKKNSRDKKRRKKDRLKRKRKIKRNIRKVVRQIRKILNKSYRNGTRDRKKKTHQLKKFIEHLKKEYRKDRKRVKDIHIQELEKIDNLLQKKIDRIKILNLEFIKNKEFREKVINGTPSLKDLRILAETYPEIGNILNSRRSGNFKPDYLDYDVEYGLLYY